MNRKKWVRSKCVFGFIEFLLYLLLQKLKLKILKHTCVWSTFAPWNNKTIRTVWGFDELQEDTPIGESLSDPAHRTCDSRGKYIFNAQGPVKLKLRAVRAEEAEIYYLNKSGRIYISHLHHSVLLLGFVCHRHLPECQAVWYLHLPKYRWTLCSSL